MKHGFRSLLACLLVGAAFIACGSSASLQVASGSGPNEPNEPGVPVGETDGGTAADGAASVSLPKTDDITIIVEPSDKAAKLLTAIEGAKASVHMTMYLLSDKRFISALIAKHAAGLDVKVILNETFPDGAGTNAATFEQLKSAGVPVQFASPAFKLTHEKCVIIDGLQAWIMTMNLTTSSPTNREYLALDSQADDVGEAEAIFAADFANTPITPTGSLVVAPTNAQKELVGLIESATSSVDLEGEELSDHEIVAALIARKNAGVAVRVVVADNSPSPAQSAAVSDLEAAKIAVVKVATPYIHAKALVVDGASAYVGSENFTTASFVSNRELGIITRNAPSVAAVATTIAKDFAAGVAP